MTPIALTIAGSDSGGGAGIQADLKTFTVHGVYGATAITALTAQNTLGVHGIHPVPAEFVRRQIDAVLSDLGADVIKTGMLANREIIATVAAALRDHRARTVVVDPVLVAQSGDRLLAADALESLVRELLPLATIVTPNLAEAEALTGSTIRTIEGMRAAALAICRLGAKACLVKGGHLAEGPATDVLCQGSALSEFSALRIDSPHTHGTGCQLSAAIAANLALGRDLPTAVAAAKAFITIAIKNGLAIGHGNGPANPMGSVPVGNGSPSA